MTLPPSAIEALNTCNKAIVLYNPLLNMVVFFVKDLELFCTTKVSKMKSMLTGGSPLAEHSSWSNSVSFTYTLVGYNITSGGTKTNK